MAIAPLAKMRACFLLALSCLLLVGCVQSTDILGRAAMNGDKAALRSLNLRAEDGHADAQGLLCMIYFQGRGAAKDKDLGVKWCKRAQSGGVDLGVLNEQILLRIAGTGDIQAQVELANHYSLDKEKSRHALEWFTKAAESGSHEAFYGLGNLYFHGYGVQVDTAKAVAWYQKAAGAGNLAACNTLGVLYEHGTYGGPKNTTEAARWYRRGADAGDASSQSSLASLYHEGNGVPKDFGLSFAWYRKAATAGDRRSQIELGNAYRLGEGVAIDLAEAARWYRRVAESTDGLPGGVFRGSSRYSPETEAQRFLGAAYYLGHGVPKDIVVGYMWLNLAASKGDEPAKRVRDMIEKAMTRDQISEAQRLTREWKPLTTEAAK